MDSPRYLVIDTQCLLDWLVFRDPASQGWASELGGQQWKWIFTSEMRKEFDHVLARGFGPRWTPPAEQVLDDAWSTLGHQVEVPVPLSTPGRLRCTDRSDQKFIDLAISAGAAALISRDKAVLKLARAAQVRHGLLIATRERWLNERDKDVAAP